MKKLNYAFLFLPLIGSHAYALPQKPKLILIISIDQFRADYLQKYSSKFLPSTGKSVGGLNFLMQKGAYFSHAEYEILQNMTCPGHATILTGAYPYQHGIPNNDWYDLEKQSWVYCAEDQEHKTVGATPASVNVGTSPKNLKTTTFGDELKNAFSDTRVVSLSLKDRSAIMMGGHRADMAFWFDSYAFQWVSSTYYMKDLPKWVSDINTKLKSKIGTQLIWNKTTDEKINPNQFVPESTVNLEMGKSFPHKANLGSYSSLLFPIGVDLPVELAKKSIDEMRLGQTKSTDILAISLSNHDYVGHNFGPESDEIKEITLQEDHALSALFNHINSKVLGGLSNTWIILTADHGVVGNPRLLKANKIEAGILDESVIQKDLENYLNNKYGKVKDGWFLPPSELNFFFNRKSLKDKELDLYDLRAEVVKYVQKKSEKFEGIADVFSGNDVRNRTLPPAQFEKQILHTYYDGRSGDIIFIQRPHFVTGYAATTHMSGYSYDRYVPMIFVGKPFKGGLYAGGKVVDIAPTLSFLMGILPPASSEGKILQQALHTIK